MKEINLIRHTTPDVKSGICYGISDLELKQSFNEEAKEIKCYLSETTTNIVYSSPISRCTRLASYLYPGLEFQRDDRLKEINFGDWELMEWGKIDRKDMDRWSSDFINIAPPNGENLKSLNERAVSFVKDVIHKHPDNATIAVVTHSGIIRCLLSYFLEIPLTKIFRFKLHFGCIAKIIIHDTFEEVEILKNNNFQSY